MTPLVPALILVLGAGGTLLGRLPRFRFTGLVAAGATLLAVAVMLGLAFRLPATAILSSWGPASLLPSPLHLRADGVDWFLGLSLLFVTLSGFLTGLSRGGGRRLAHRATMLLVSAAVLLAIFADDLITLAVTWAALDLLYFLAVIALSEGDERRPVIGLIFNSAATLFVVAAAIELTRHGLGLHIGSALTSRAVLLLALAAVFRLGLFPVHLGLPVEANVRQGLGTLLRLAPAAVALDLLTRMVSMGQALPLRPWLTAAAVIAALLGAAQWWAAGDPRQGLSYVVLSQSGLALLIGLWGGDLAAVGIAAQAATLLLAGALLFLSNGHDVHRPAWTALPVAGALALLGLPLLLGFVGARALYGGLSQAGAWLVLALSLGAQVMLAAGLARLCSWPGEAVTDDEPLVGLAYLSGLGLPLLLLFVAGVLPGGLARMVGGSDVGLNLLSSASLMSLGGVTLAGVIGLALWRFEADVRTRASVAWTGLTGAAQLGWLYSLLWEIYRWLGRVLRGTAGILEGEGAILWTLVAAWLVWLLFQGR